MWSQIKVKCLNNATIYIIANGNHSQRDSLSISSNKDQPNVKTELAWSAIVADNFGVTDNVHFLTRGCCI